MAETRSTSSKDRGDAILDAALDLAERGGFDHVRQREVAARANVALGTLYKRFRSKEDLLAAAMSREAERLEKKLERRPAHGSTIPTRVSAFFAIATRHICKRPQVAHAMIRAMASGVPEIAAKVAGYQGRMTGLVIAAMRGRGKLEFVDAAGAPPTEREMTYAFMLLQLWFASLVGWSAGLFVQTTVSDQMSRAAHVLAKGLDIG
ncbi:MAG TPA: TetR/AcrR family transcriptional regulator [Kofleriaceae bacterium]|nr:TetR/AcrR family transcriptional regulator [Kofleriaceae bacterium]